MDGTADSKCHVGHSLLLLALMLFIEVFFRLISHNSSTTTVTSIHEYTTQGRANKTRNQGRAPFVQLYTCFIRVYDF
jgi:hypothetical protein